MQRSKGNKPTESCLCSGYVINPWKDENYKVMNMRTYLGTAGSGIKFKDNHHSYRGGS